MVTQNIFDVIDKILLMMDYLFTHLEIKHWNYIVGSFMATYIDIIWTKFIQYYAMIDDAMVY